MRKKSSGYTFLDMTKEVMEMEKKPLTVAQIWKYGEINNLTDKIGSKGKTPLNTLQARLYIDIRDNENSIFTQTSKRPSKFYLKNLECEDGTDGEIVEIEPTGYNERDLHLLLSSVIYDETNRAKEYLPENEWWRIVKLDLSNKEHIIDWTHEREWRVPGELCFEYSQCEIIVPNSKYYKKFVKYCLDKNREDILLKIRGIVVIASVYF